MPCLEDRWRDKKLQHQNLCRSYQSLISNIWGLIGVVTSPELSPCQHSIQASWYQVIAGARGAKSFTHFLLWECFGKFHKFSSWRMLYVMVATGTVWYLHVSEKEAHQCYFKTLTFVLLEVFTNLKDWYFVIFLKVAYLPPNVFKDATLYKGKGTDNEKKR